MELEFSQNLFFVLAAALAGGLAVKILKLQPLLGYIISGIIFGSIFPSQSLSVSRVAEIGAIFLLFSIGLELSLSKLLRVFSTAIFGAGVQIILVTLLIYVFLTLAGISTTTALVLAAGFSLSSTAIVVKILSDRGEEETIHGQLMIGWLLAQDLAVIPIMVVLPSLAGGEGALLFALSALGKAGILLVAAVILGKLVAPGVVHAIASTNSRELLTLSAVVLALGTAGLSSYLGISPILGAFIAGVVISESQEKHAVFSETRPLRDLFVALFFVSLGFLATISVIISSFWLILGLSITILLLKFLVVFFVSLIFGNRGRVAFITAIGLAQVGEFSFVIFSFGRNLGLLSEYATSVGIATALVTLIVTPFLLRNSQVIWKKIKERTEKVGFLNKILAAPEKKVTEDDLEISDHIVICGYGRVGSWVGRALSDFKIPFVVVDYNQKIINDLKSEGTIAIYGDPSEPEILEAANIRKAKALVLAIPDRTVQENLIAYTQTVNPKVKIISRVHLDEDWEKLKLLRVDKVVQPEFEAAIAIVKSMLASRGKTNVEIADSIKKLRLSHAKI